MTGKEIIGLICSEITVVSVYVIIIRILIKFEIIKTRINGIDVDEVKRKLIGELKRELDPNYVEGSSSNYPGIDTYKNKVESEPYVLLSISSLMLIATASTIILMVWY